MIDSQKKTEQSSPEAVLGRIPAVPVGRAMLPALVGWHTSLSAGEWCAGLQVFQITVYVASLTLVNIHSLQADCLIAVVFLFKTATSSSGDMLCRDATTFLPEDVVELNRCL